MKLKGTLVQEFFSRGVVDFWNGLNDSIQSQWTSSHFEGATKLSIEYAVGELVVDLA